ncbi:MAG: LCP family protein [Oscillospiraceae bacterium]|nr:LCP family protein [Oscillospiraceae bacterium]
MKQKKKRGSLLRGFMRFVCTVLGIILALMIAVTVYFQSLLGQINYIDPEDVTLLSQEEVDALDAADTIAVNPDAPTEAVEFEDHDTTIGGKRSGIINILLIGQDRRPGEARARSDSMILCSFNKNTKTLTLTSFLRDLYVQIPGYQDNRINSAYAAGGMTLLNDTLETNFGIQVDGNVEVDFSQFAQIVDLMGGVTIELRQDEADLINKDVGGSLTAGSCLLNGEQALTYARIRKLDADGDFSRTSRQRKVIDAMIGAYKDSSLTTLLKLLDQVLPMVTTDIKNTRLVAYALELFPMLSDITIVSQRIPADGTYSGQTIRGMSVLVADMEANREILSDTILGTSE